MRRAGQSSVEYAIVVASAAVAFLGIAMYLSRGFQGRFRRTAEFLGPVYGPGLVESREVTNLNSESNQVAFIITEGVDAARTRVTEASTAQVLNRRRDETFTDHTETNLFE